MSTSAPKAFPICKLTIALPSNARWWPNGKHERENVDNEEIQFANLKHVIKKAKKYLWDPRDTNLPKNHVSFISK